MYHTLDPRATEPGPSSCKEIRIVVYELLGTFPHLDIKFQGKRTTLYRNLIRAIFGLPRTHSCAKRSSLFVFALNYSKPNDMPSCLHHRRNFISDYNRGFIFAHGSGWQFKMDPHLSPLQTPERQRASRKGTQRQEQRLWIKFGSKRGIGAVHGQVDWLPSGTTPTKFCATLFFQWFFV
jgi:hypothetical protein